jgi:CubicO group peptidase (beta-lactamase class C family)
MSTFNIKARAVHKWLLAALVTLAAGQVMEAKAATGTLPGQQSTAPVALPQEELENYLQEQVQKGFRGVVLVARSGQIVLEQAYGSPASGQPQAAFWIGSLAKQFTAAAILKLAEQGKLQLSDPVTRFWPQAPADKRSITIGHLLSHTSGLGTHYVADGVTAREQAVKRILAIKPSTQLGTYAYSNDGYNLLAIVVELASGLSYEQYVQTQLLQPAGLQQTGFWGLVPASAAMAPWLQTSGGANQPPKPRKNIFAAGQPVANYGFRGGTGFYSTAADLYRWIAALRSQRVLTDSSQQKLFAPQVLVRTDPGPEDVHYGLGWVVVTQKGRTTEIRHGGAEDWLGHNAMIRMVGDDVVIVLSNAGTYQDSEWATLVSSGLRKRLRP